MGSEPPNADAASPMLKAVSNRPFSWRGYATEIQRFFADAQTSTDRKQMLNLRAAKSGSEPTSPIFCTAAKVRCGEMGF